MQTAVRSPALCSPQAHDVPELQARTRDQLVGAFTPGGLEETPPPGRSLNTVQAPPSSAVLCAKTPVGARNLSSEPCIMFSLRSQAHCKVSFINQAQYDINNNKTEHL